MKSKRGVIVRRTFVIYLVGVVSGAVLAHYLRRGVTTQKTLAEPLPAIELALDRKLPDFSFERTPLPDVLAKISQASGVPIEYDDSSGRRHQDTGLFGENLSESKLKSLSDCPVRLRLRQATLSQAMDQVLRAAAERDTPRGWTLDDRRIVVFRPGYDPLYLTRVYDVKDLLDEAEHRAVATIPIDSGPAPIGFMCRLSGVRAADKHETLQLILSQIGDLKGLMHSRFIGSRMIVDGSARDHHDLRKALARLRTPSPTLASLPPEAKSERFDDRIGVWVSTRSDAALETLSARLPVFEARGKSLNSGLTALADATGLRFCIEPVALSEIKERGLPIEIKLKNVTAIDALRALLTCAGGPTTPPPNGFDRLPIHLDWWLDGEVVTITTEDDAASHQVTQLYEMRQWLASSPGTKTDPPDAAQAAANQAATAGLIQTLQNAISPKSWNGNGGHGSAIDVGGNLIIRQSVENHERIRVFLDKLRRGKSAVLTSEPRSAEP